MEKMRKKIPMPRPSMIKHEMERIISMSVQISIRNKYNNFQDNNKQLKNSLLSKMRFHMNFEQILNKQSKINVQRD